MFNILISKHYVKCSDWLIYKVPVFQIVQSEHRIYRYDVMIGYFTIMDTTCTWNCFITVRPQITPYMKNLFPGN